jgi:hypothetical protein
VVLVHEADPLEIGILLQVIDDDPFPGQATVRGLQDGPGVEMFQ